MIMERNRDRLIVALRTQHKCTHTHTQTHRRGREGTEKKNRGTQKNPALSAKSERLASCILIDLLLLDLNLFKGIGTQIIQLNIS